MQARTVRQKNVIANAANATITRVNAGSTLNNLGAAGAITLVVSDMEPGDFYDIDVLAAQTVAVDGGAAGVFVLAGVNGTAGQKLHLPATLGDSCQILCIGAGPKLQVRNVTGTLTVS